MTAGAVPLPLGPAQGSAHRSARREQLLDAVERIVSRDGPAASMAAIAAEAGVTKPVLYRHFGDKDGLVAALAERYTSRLYDGLRTALAEGRTRRQRLERAMDAYLAGIEARPDVYRFLLRSEVSPQVSRELRGFTGQLAQTLARGIAAELGRPAAVREQAWAYGVVGLVQAAGDWWLDAVPYSRQELVGDLVDLLWGAYASS